MKTHLAERFATVVNGKIVAINDNATPAHELTPNQFPLTNEEFYLLRAVSGANGNVIELARKYLDNVEKKLLLCSGNKK